MGISASVGLTMFVFTFVLGLAADVTIVREDVAYIKGILDSWVVNDYTGFNIKP